MKNLENRRIFFNDQNLDLSVYHIFLGPTLCFIYSLPRLILLLPASVLPLLFEDISRKMKGWETQGKMIKFMMQVDIYFLFNVLVAYAL